MHIDPKAPATSPQHPRNWRQPLFLSPAPRPAVVDTPPVAPEKAPAKKSAGKKVTHRAKPALAEALAALDGQ